MNDSFIIYTSYLKIFEQLTDAQLGQLTRHMLSFAKTGEEPNIEDPIVKLSFAFIKDDIERNQRKYEEKCERLRANARKRWDKKQLEADASENMQKDTNVSKSMQLHANAQIAMHNDDNNNDNDNDVPNETIKEERDKEETSSSKSISGKPKVDAPSRAAKIDFAAIKEYWNCRHDETGSAMRRLTLMSEQRKSNVRARLREVGGDESKIYKAIDIAMESDFMNGKNGKGWIASFDWIMCPANFPKVLEGNYTNEERKQQPAQDPTATARQTIGERWEQAKHKQQPADSQQEQDNKFAWIIQQNLEDLRKNPQNKPARQSLTKFYEQGVLQKLGIDWKPDK